MENPILQNASSGLDDYLLQKKIELMININNKKIANELEGIRSTLGKLSEELHQLKRGLDSNILRTSVESAKTFSDVDTTQSDFKRAKNAETAKPRFGDYKPKDVAIDKFFYFGNKAVN